MDKKPWCPRHNRPLRVYADGARYCPQCLAARELPLSPHDEYGAASPYRDVDRRTLEKRIEALQREVRTLRGAIFGAREYMKEQSYNMADKVLQGAYYGSEDNA